MAFKAFQDQHSATSHQFYTMSNAIWQERFKISMLSTRYTRKCFTLMKQSHMAKHFILTKRNVFVEQRFLCKKIQPILHRLRICIETNSWYRHFWKRAQTFQPCLLQLWNQQVLPEDCSFYFSHLNCGGRNFLKLIIKIGSWKNWKAWKFSFAI